MLKQLTWIWEKYLDTHFVKAFLRSLLELYCTLVVLLETRPCTKLTLNIDTTQLLQQKSHDKNLGLSLEVTLGVGRKSKLHVYSYISIGSSNNYKIDAKCRYYDKNNHYEIECCTKEKDKKTIKLRKLF